MTKYINDTMQTGPGKSLVAVVPDYKHTTEEDVGKTSLLRLGAYDTEDEKIILGKLHDPWKKTLPNEAFPDGWLEYTDGDRTVVTQGTKREFIRGISELNITDKDDTEPIYKLKYFKQLNGVWRKREAGRVTSDSYWFGDTETFFGGFKFDAMFGLGINLFVGGKLDASAGISAKVDLGYALEIGAGLKYSVCYEAIAVANDHEIKGRKSIHLRIKETGTKMAEMAANQTTAIAVAVAGCAVAAILAGGAAAIRINDDGTAPATGAMMGAATIPMSVCLAFSVMAALEARTALRKKVKSDAEIEMYKNQIAIRHWEKDVICGEIYAGVINPEDENSPGGMVRLKNHKDCSIELGPDGTTTIQAGKKLKWHAGETIEVGLGRKDNGTMKFTKTMVDICNNALRIQSS